MADHPVGGHEANILSLIEVVLAVVVGVVVWKTADREPEGVTGVLAVGVDALTPLVIGNWLLGASGLATSFVTRDDRRYVSGVRKLIGDKLPKPVRLESYDASGGDDRPKPKGKGQYRSNRRSRRPSSRGRSGSATK
ncbi:hypothetical protein LCGC14_0093690 [marine sediment metagenome]|uniref:Uncharacterized protein n=1 Tax=marine sediment metagenome TaxID=412755 RepID=A0A0F9VHC1_9ZZZZ|nr:hypothetical protein [Phycisphaerae bacterium]HDZ44033.1 hypothetical protein [Phycisphaerae bacterium]